MATMRQHNGMRPQDIVIIFKLISNWHLPDGWQVFNKSTLFTAKSVSDELKISPAEVGHSIRRSQFAGLVGNDKHTIAYRALYEFLIYGIKYVFPVKPGHLTRGVPTAHSASPLNAVIQASEQYVWPHEEGELRGQAIEPLFRTVPEVVASDDHFYQLLALTDALRVGRSREVLLARKTLKQFLFIED